MKVGDLVRYTLPSKGKFYIGLPVSAKTTLLALVIKSGPCGGTLIKWFDDGTVENVNIYVVEELEVISEGR